MASIKEALENSDNPFIAVVNTGKNLTGSMKKNNYDDVFLASPDEIIATKESVEFIHYERDHYDDETLTDELKASGVESGMPIPFSGYVKLVADGWTVA